MRRAFIAALALLVWLSAAAGVARAEFTEDDILGAALSSNEPYAYSLALRAEEADSDEAEALLEEALRYAPDNPGLYFKLSFARLPNVISSFSVLIDGMKAYGRNFWWATGLIGLAVICLLISLVATLLLAILVRLPMEMPLLVHDINENKAKLLVPLMLLPLALLGPLALVGGLVVLLGLYLRRSDKWVVYLLLILLAAAPFTVGLVDTLFSAPTPENQAIVAVTEGRDNRLAIQTLSGRRDFVSRYIYALALKRQGYSENSIEILKSILEAQSDYRVYTALGNAYYSLGDGTQAKEYYNKALQVKKTPTTMFNLSQALRDELNYREGDKIYDEAYNMDPARVSRFNQVAGQNLKRVFDERLTWGELLDTITASKKKMVPLYSGDVNVLAGVGVLLLVVMALLDALSKVRAYRCTKCNAVACLRCTDPKQMNQMCSLCQSSQGAEEDTSAKAKVARMLLASKEKSRSVGFMRALSFTMPGLAQMYSGRLTPGVLYCWSFCFFLVIMILNPLFDTALGGMSHGWIYVLGVPAMVLAYYLSMVSVNRRLDKGWL